MFNKDLEDAGRLAQWLIEKKGIALKTAYIIGARKFKIENWHDVQKYYDQQLKPKQLSLV